MSDSTPKEPQPYSQPEAETHPRQEGNAQSALTETYSTPPPVSNIEPAPSHSRSENWIWGIVLIAIGAVFLLQNLTPFRLINWWAIFILIPAAGSFVTAWRKYQETGRLTRSARGSLFGGLIFTTVAAIFLFNLDLSRFWPVIIIAAGLAMMANTLLPE
jgi:hypothetical protein